MCAWAVCVCVGCAVPGLGVLAQNTFWASTSAGYPQHRNSAYFGAGPQLAHRFQNGRRGHMLSRFCLCSCFFLRFPGFRGFPGFSLGFGEGVEG